MYVEDSSGKLQMTLLSTERVKVEILRSRAIHILEGINIFNKNLIYVRNISISIKKKFKFRRLKIAKAPIGRLTRAV